jgi:hypothetical protein
MRKSDYECRINSVMAEKIEIEIKSGGPHLKVLCALLNSRENEGAVLHGKLPIETNWPREVIEAAEELLSVIEDHLINMHFDGGGHGSSRRPLRDSNIPAGLGGSGLASSEEEPEQL